MNKRQAEIIPASRKNEKKFPPSNDKENNSKASNAIPTASLFIIEKKKKIVYDTDEDTSTKKRASSPKQSESTCDTKSVSDKSVSTKKKANTEKIQERVVYSNIGRRKYSELKKEDKFKTTQKKKVVLHNKKIYRETIKFSDDATKTIHAFPLYSENDILNIVFEVELIEQELDNDVETDQEQLKDSRKHVLNSLKEGIKEYKKMCK